MDQSVCSRLGKQSKAVFDGLPGITVLDLLAMELNGATLPGHSAKEVLQHFRAAGTIQTSNTQDLSLMELEGGVLQAGILTGNVLYVQDDLARLIGLGREAVGQFTAHHQLDDLIHG